LTHETALIFTPIPEIISVNSCRLADSQIKAGFCGSKISNAITLGVTPERGAFSFYNVYA
jgi:hypothetical protein